MSELLKDRLNQDVVEDLANNICSIYPEFRKKAFCEKVAFTLSELELKDRARLIADQLKLFLPSNYQKAVQVLTDSLGEPLKGTGWGGGHIYYYMAHALFVEKYGVEYFNESMQANYEITKRATAEFSVRPFLERYPTETLNLFKKWIQDENEHVRRLVSEGSRPRLPWASQLPAFKDDPTPVFSLLEKLKDDPSLYVRRSVANNLNDISKDNAEQVLSFLERWSHSASRERKWLIKHALRTLLKKGNSRALALLGYVKPEQMEIRKKSISPAEVKLGSKVQIEFEAVNESERKQAIMVDLIVHYRKASGALSPKVFKVGAAELEPSQKKPFRKQLSLKEMTTRNHYAGVHLVEALINGEKRSIGEFELTF